MLEALCNEAGVDGVGYGLRLPSGLPFPSSFSSFCLGAFRYNL